MNPNRLKIYWSLALEHPLYFLNAYFSAVITSFLLAMQPNFLKVFINEASRGVTRNHLIFIAGFMLASLFLAFFFDTIQVTTSVVFRLAIEKKIRILHFRFATKRNTNDISFPIQRGIFGLTEFTLMTSLELLVSLTNVVIVLYFIFESNKLIGGFVGVLFLFLVSGTFPLLKKIGATSKTKEEIKKNFLDQFNKSNDKKYGELLDKIGVAEIDRFKLESILVFSKFFVFKVTPTLIIFYYILTNVNDYGELASMFLYFGILYQPVTKLIEIIKQSLSFFSQAEIFKDEIEKAILIEKKLEILPYGLVCIQEHISCDTQLNFEQLRENSRTSVQIYYGSSMDEIMNSDFVFTKNNELVTTANFIWNCK